jgi:hypothetical protein
LIAGWELRDRRGEASARWDVEEQLVGDAVRLRRRSAARKIAAAAVVLRYHENHRTT